MKESPIILAIETATAIGSVAVFSGENLLGSMTILREQSHAKLLTPMIQSLLAHLEIAPSDLDAIGVAKGPGSYTGLRVGVSTAKGLCMAVDKPLLSTGSLDALAGQVTGLATQLNAWICPMIDARRMEVYCALFNSQIEMLSPVEAKIIESGAFSDILATQKVIFVGDGADKCREILSISPNALILPDILSNATGMGKSLYRQFMEGAFEDIITFEPFYLKEFRATKPKNLLGM
ncbi:MAG: tRNA (adenosine(37)-N6)-threonylcarbamoyltransferase complex dimerization subunit type 1 TsaB [Bacteroidia bacterium]|nr:tRNA (adenosine(37)-N6)-threonylcarbamoyltransferase complex dimerization subunit type 1 TsaB [Bacteroidia bacterium]